ncbi:MULTISPECIES: MFS transporter [unclassified Novosphingobium]|uniref:MFS transporter n=1 Tax=unclassified Novosphingobium TaxID=2644732 RepID=UPI00086AAD9D|nr:MULTISPECIES: MFS transporter [unclassified Novosphingobium]MDR6707359.1 AAHS family 4-hydroxybenzoate transporter-like MFS transporter [Novosphingobium sp. 1748]ODU83312.1 MAG: hypothetical protein ABT10_06780 [Novosphingobium sp. SCN 63-17]OJX96418.1 MAG: MFS transporter [Novosphingobium sp. 63-713]
MTAAQSQTPPLTGRILVTLIFCALFMLIEGLDLASMPLAVPRISAAWGMPAFAFALSLSAIVIGVGLAAVALAPLGERVGRRRMIWIAGLVAALASGATAFSGSMGVLIFWRFMTGLGLGACLPNVTACVVQIAPVAGRSRILAAVNTAIPVGGVLAGFLMAPLVRIGHWQALFLAVAALTVFCSLALRLLLPATNGQPAEQAPHGGAGLPLRELLSREHLFKTVLLIGLGTANTFLLYLLINWLPTLLPRAGVSLDAAARMSGLFQLGGIFGGFVFAYLIDKNRPVRAFLCGYGLALMTLGIMFVPGLSAPVWAATVLALGMGVSGAHVAITLFGVIFYPQRLLSSYIGVSIAVTRIGAIAGPLAGGWLLAVDSGVGSFLTGTMLGLGLCLLWVLAIAHFGHRREGNQPAALPA